MPSFHKLSEIYLGIDCCCSKLLLTDVSYQKIKWKQQSEYYVEQKKDEVGRTCSPPPLKTTRIICLL